MNTDNNGGLRELALFAGAFGGGLGGHLLGWRTLCAVEWDAYAASVLVARQNDGCLPHFPVWDDVQTFDGRPWRGRIDVVSGGFPCQDISAAGKGAGIDGERSGMWTHMARIIGEVRPRFAFVENSPMLTLRGLGRVLGDLAAMGYHARWGVVSAADAGAPHLRERIWILATDSASGGCAGQGRSGSNHRIWPGAAGERRDVCSVAGDNGKSESLAHTNRLDDYNGGPGAGQIRRQQGIESPQLRGCEVVADAEGKPRRNIGENIADGAGRNSGEIAYAGNCDGAWWQFEPDVGRVAHGVASRVDRLRCIGNGQVPAVVRLAWRLLGGPMMNNTFDQPTNNGG